MYDAFVAYIRILWEKMPKMLKEKSRSKPARTLTPDDYETANDFLLHRAAFVFVTGAHENTAQNWYSPESFILAAQRKNGKSSLWAKMLGMLKNVYLATGLGWDNSKVITNTATYQAEMDRIAELAEQGIEEKPLNELFPSYFYHRKLIGDNIKREKVRAAAQKHREREEQEQKERLAQNISTGKADSVLLAGIAEKLGEKRFDL